MYCSKCGQPIGAQPFCPSCGTATGMANPASGMPPAQFFSFSRVERHLRTLGILWVVFSAWLLLRWLLLLPFLHAFGSRTPWIAAGSDTWIYAPLHPGGWLLRFITAVVIVRVILSLAVGVALLTRQPWGRIYAIIIAVLTLLKPIVGTILAIYTLWVLLCRNAGQQYDRLALAREVRPL